MTYYLRHHRSLCIIMFSTTVMCKFHGKSENYMHQTDGSCDRKKKCFRKLSVFFQRIILFSSYFSRENKIAGKITHGISSSITQKWHSVSIVYIFFYCRNVNIKIASSDNETSSIINRFFCQEILLNQQFFFCFLQCCTVNNHPLNF